MMVTVKEVSAKEWYGAGDLDKETELIQEEATTEGITNQTQVLTIFCC